MSARDINRLSKLYMTLGIVSILMVTAISTRIWIAGMTIGNEKLFGMSFLIAAIYFVGSTSVLSVLFYVSRMIMKRKRFVLCKTISIFICFMFPVGTALGAYSLSILGKNQSEFKD
jgi:hypothetical protein